MSEIDMLDYTKSKNLSGILISVDFEKAFDSLEWNFMLKALQKFNFGTSFINWVTLFYTDIEACITNNGSTSGYFKLQRGVRQGDPLSPYLFILAIELFAQAVRESKTIKGIKINEDSEIKISQYADDTNGILDGIVSARAFLEILRKFECCSGLKVNKEKTEAMWLGNERSSNRTPLGIKWVKTIKLLGIYVSYNDEDTTKKNLEEKLKSVRQTLSLWRMRNLTLTGKILISKSLIISKFVYSLSVLSIPETFIKIIEKIIWNFIWDGKKAKIRREVLISDYKHGGLRYPDLRSIFLSSKVKWIQQYFEISNHHWKILFDNYFSRYGGIALFIHCNIDTKLLDLYEMPAFYKDIIEIISICTKNDRNEIIWNNRNILKQKHSSFD